MMTDAENEDGEDAAGKNDQKTAFGNRYRFAPSCAFDAPLSLLFDDGCYYYY